MEEENQLIAQRKQKLRNLLDKKINPYAYEYNKKDYSSDIIKDNKKLKKGEQTKKKVSLAGRILVVRGMGKATFAHVQDSRGKIQIYVTQDTVGKEKYKLFTKLDVGDIIGFNGTVFRTKLGEISVFVKNFELLTKSIRPLPEKWHGLKDKEIRYRQRYLDLIVSPEIKEIFKKRSLIINSMRNFLVKQGFSEVETPILQPIYGGTNAKPFETKLNALNMKVFMRISNEMYLKRLIVGGYEKIFEFSYDFRNEGIDKTHNPEFLQMETMWAYKDYKANMDFVEKMISYIAKDVLKTTNIEYQDKKIDLKSPWEKMTMIQAIKKYAKIDVNKLTDQELSNILRNYNIEYEGDFSRGVAIELIFEELVEDKLIQPTIIYDYPIDNSPLAKPKRDDPNFVERFEVFINGWEIANSYSELNDPEILSNNWKKQEQNLVKGNLEAQKTDLDFVRALEYGMPPTSGLGIGVDRLVMLLTNSLSIKDVIFFPFMRSENDKS